MDTPEIKVPPGYELIQLPGGRYNVVKRLNEDRLVKTLAFRVSSRELADLTVFIESFPQKEFGVALRWLLNHEDVKQIIQDRVRSQTRPAR